MNEEPKPLLKAEQVAEILAIPVSTLKKNVSCNPASIPPFIKLGKAVNSPVRWRVKDVDVWLDNQ